jgi:hypothetical protein
MFDPFTKLVARYPTQTFLWVGNKVEAKALEPTRWGGLFRAATTFTEA